MTDPQGSLQSTPVDSQSLTPRSTSWQPDQNEAAASLPPDHQVPLVLKNVPGFRGPKPTSLTWGQMKDAQKESEGVGTSGTVSPVSPISFSDATRTANLHDPQRQPHVHPPSPGSFRQLPPRVHSPASQIFERSVQEDIVPAHASPSIPAHIRTENYIPPVLEASSVAITDDHLNPDSVEIVTHSLHQPASAGVAGTSSMEQSMSSSGIMDQMGTHPADADEISSAHGALDSADVRRLSFISFADVVNAEHAETGESLCSRDATQHETLPGNATTVGSQTWSPSPVRSPSSSHGLGTSPPTSIATSFKGLDMSPNHGLHGPGSPLSMAQSPVSSNFGGELNVETMRQALRRTGSGDLSGVQSQAASAVGMDEIFDRPT